MILLSMLSAEDVLSLFCSFGVKLLTLSMSRLFFSSCLSSTRSLFSCRFFSFSSYFACFFASLFCLFCSFMAAFVSLFACFAASFASFASLFMRLFFVFLYTLSSTLCNSLRSDFAAFIFFLSLRYGLCTKYPTVPIIIRSSASASPTIVTYSRYCGYSL